jgi:outer membrane protein TolC
LGVNKLLKSGDTIELQGNYIRDESEFIIINSQPNPLSTTGIDLNYRMPLLQNQLNKRYLLDYDSANSKFTESINTQLIIRDQIILQAIDLYYGSASLNETLKTAQHSIVRARKLKEHIRKNITIGLLEKGEILQPNAQIRNLQGKYQELKLVWEQNEIAINRLIGKSWNTAFTPVVDKSSIKKFDSDVISSNVNKYNPELKSLKLNLKLADSVIALQQDNTESKLDVVFSIGALATQGPSQVGSIDDRDVVGGVRLEYQQALDKRGLNSKLYQSRIDKENIKIQISKLEKDLEYETYSLISNINRITKVNVRYKQRHDLEVEKYKDIINRYQAGRTTTNIVIQFDNERTQAELDYKTQKILLEKTISILKLKQGGFDINKEYK